VRRHSNEIQSSSVTFPSFDGLIRENQTMFSINGKVYLLHTHTLRNIRLCVGSTFNDPILLSHSSWKLSMWNPQTIKFQRCVCCSVFTSEVYDHMVLYKLGYYYFYHPCTDRRLHMLTTHWAEVHHWLPTGHIAAYATK